jgi:hypothetical protein
MKIRSGFVSNSSSSSFVVHIKNEHGMKKLLEIFDAYKFYTGDNSHIVICGEESVITERIKANRNQASYWVKNNIGSYQDIFPYCFVLDCEKFVKYEKKYGGDIALIKISDYDWDTIGKIKRCPNLAILEKEER